MTKTHHVLGIVLGIVGILVAVLAGLFVGVVAGVVAAILGIIAILLGVNARKAKKGTGAILTGLLAIIFAVVMTVTSINLVKTVKDYAAEEGMDELAKYCNKPYLGLAGILTEISKASEEDQEVLREQLEKVLKDYNQTSDSAAPAQEAAPTGEPAGEPTAEPTAEPTDEPEVSPTAEPEVSPAP